MLLPLLIIENQFRYCFTCESKESCLVLACYLFGTLSKKNYPDLLNVIKFLYFMTSFHICHKFYVSCGFSLSIILFMRISELLSCLHSEQGAREHGNDIYRNLLHVKASCSHAKKSWFWSHLHQWQNESGSLYLSRCANLFAHSVL